jgi:hypothetical protein
MKADAIPTIAALYDAAQKAQGGLAEADGPL